MPTTRAGTPTTPVQDPERDELEHVLKNFMRVKDTDDIRLYVTQQEITSVNDLINYVDTNDMAKDMRVMKDDDFIPLSDPQRGRLVQLLNFQRYKALEDENGIFND